MALCCRFRRCRRPARPAPRLQDSVHKRRAEPQHLKPGAPNVLIILLDDVGFGQASTFGGEMNTPTLTKLASQGISYNTLPHHVDLLADARGVADRAQSPARRQRHDRRTRGRLGRLHRRDPEDLGDAWPRSCGTTATRRRPSASGTTRRPTRPRRWVRSTAGRPGTASTISTASSPARRRNGNRGWSRTPTAVEPPHDEKYHLTEDMAAARHRLAAQASRVRAGQAVLHVLGTRRGARSAPGRQGVVRQVQGQVRRRLGCLPRARVRAPEAARLDSGRHEAHAARRDRCPPGPAFRRPSARSSSG